MLPETCLSTLALARENMVEQRRAIVPREQKESGCFCAEKSSPEQSRARDTRVLQVHRVKSCCYLSDVGP